MKPRGKKFEESEKPEEEEKQPESSDVVEDEVEDVSSLVESQEKAEKNQKFVFCCSQLAEDQMVLNVRLLRFSNLPVVRQRNVPRTIKSCRDEAVLVWTDNTPCHFSDISWK